MSIWHLLQRNQGQSPRCLKTWRVCMAPHRFGLSFYNISRIFVALLVLFIACEGMLLAQQPTATGTLKGEVKDVDAQPLPGVNVTATGSAGTKNTYTDTNGQFVLAGLAAGTYDVTVELSGFVTITQTDVQVNAGEN